MVTKVVPVFAESNEALNFRSFIRFHIFAFVFGPGFGVQKQGPVSALGLVLL